MMAIVSMEIVDAKNMQNSIATIENVFLYLFCFSIFSKYFY